MLLGGINLVSNEVVPRPTIVRVEPLVPIPTENLGSKNVV